MADIMGWGSRVRRGGGGALGEGARGEGDAVEAFFHGGAVGDPAFEAGDLGFGAFPKQGDFAAELAGEAVVAVVELGVEGALPVGEPTADLALELLDGGCRGFRAFKAATCWIWAASRWVSSRCWDRRSSVCSRVVSRGGGRFP